MCNPKKPENEGQATGALVCGICNLLIPGIPASVYGCIVGDSLAVLSGIFQLVTAPFIVGIVWGIVYGIFLILQYTEFQSEHRESAQSPPPFIGVVAQGQPVPPGYPQYTGSPPHLGAAPPSPYPPIAYGHPPTSPPISPPAGAHPMQQPQPYPPKYG